MTSIGINLSDTYALKALIRELEILASSVDSVNIREFEAANDKMRVFVTVPRSKHLLSF